MLRAQTNAIARVSMLVLVSMMKCNAFAPIHHVVVSSASAGARETTLHVVPPDALWANTLTTALDVFDGSGIDPVVVSDAFWARLQGNFISVLIGNFLAAIVFSFFISQASAQMSKLGSFVTESIFKGDKSIGGSRASTTSTFRRA